MRRYSRKLKVENDKTPSGATHPTALPRLACLIVPWHVHLFAVRRRVRGRVDVPV